MTEYMASSALVGRRPSSSRMDSYSSALRPSSFQGISLSGIAAASATVSGWAAGIMGSDAMGAPD